MPPLRRRAKSRVVAPATVYFTQARNPEGRRQLAVFAECAYGGTRVGPIWGHTRPSVSRCLATLSKSCDCGRPYHRHKYTEGYPVRKAQD